MDKLFEDYVAYRQRRRKRRDVLVLGENKARTTK
jgi:hypothetical protein